MAPPCQFRADRSWDIKVQQTSFAALSIWRQKSLVPCFIRPFNNKEMAVATERHARRSRCKLSAHGIAKSPPNSGRSATLPHDSSGVTLTATSTTTLLQSENKMSPRIYARANPHKRAKHQRTEVSQNNEAAQQSSSLSTGTVTRAARRAVRGKRGSLAAMPSMPLDVLLEVCPSNCGSC